MPPRSLQGRTCSVSCDGGRARALQQTCSVECAMPSPLAGHAVNPSMGASWRHPCRHRSPHTAPRTCLVAAPKNEHIALKLAGCCVESSAPRLPRLILTNDRQTSLGGGA
ncbi:hypothetical protein EIQ03_19745 [Xanthomonas campestris pv. raphani]